MTTSSTAAVNGIAMLNPQRWGAQAADGYSTDFSKDDADLLDDADLVEGSKRPGLQLLSELQPMMFKTIL